MPYGVQMNWGLGYRPADKCTSEIYSSIDIYVCTTYVYIYTYMYDAMYLIAFIAACANVFMCMLPGKHVHVCVCPWIWVGVYIHMYAHMQSVHMSMYMASSSKVQIRAYIQV